MAVSDTARYSQQWLVTACSCQLSNHMASPMNIHNNWTIDHCSRGNHSSHCPVLRQMCSTGGEATPCTRRHQQGSRMVMLLCGIADCLLVVHRWQQAMQIKSILYTYMYPVCFAADSTPARTSCKVRCSAPEPGPYISRHTCMLLRILLAAVPAFKQDKTISVGRRQDYRDEPTRMITACMRVVAFLCEVLQMRTNETDGCASQEKEL